MDELLEMAVVGVVTVVIVVLIGFSLAWINLTFFDNVPVTVFVDDSLVYRGTSGCVSVNSSGANTTVSVKGGPACLFPRAYYVSRQVTLIGDKRQREE